MTERLNCTELKVLLRKQRIIRENKQQGAVYKVQLVKSLLRKQYSVVVQLLSCLQLLVTHGLQPNEFLCPWDFPGKNTGVGCHSLLQQIFPGIEPMSTTLAGGFFNTEPSGKPKEVVFRSQQILLGTGAHRPQGKTSFFVLEGLRGSCVIGAQQAEGREEWRSNRRHVMYSVCLCVCVSCSVISDSLQPQGLQPVRLLCPWGWQTMARGLNLACYIFQ